MVLLHCQPQTMIFLSDWCSLLSYLLNTAMYEHGYGSLWASSWELGNYCVVFLSVKLQPGLLFDLYLRTTWKWCFSVPWLSSGWNAGLAVNRSPVHIPAATMLSSTLGKLFSHMCLSPSSITGASQWAVMPTFTFPCLGKVNVGLALHWPHFTDIIGSPPTGSRPKRGRLVPTCSLWWSVVNFTFIGVVEWTVFLNCCVVLFVATDGRSSSSGHSQHDPGAGVLQAGAH